MRINLSGFQLIQSKGHSPHNIRPYRNYSHSLTSLTHPRHKEPRLWARTLASAPRFRRMSCLWAGLQGGQCPALPWSVEGKAEARLAPELPNRRPPRAGCSRPAHGGTFWLPPVTHSPRRLSQPPARLQLSTPGSSE